MSFNNKPITAKIKRTTKGGMVQQPILNMGGPVKMKASSPAKVDPDSTKKKQEDFKNEMANQVKTKAADLAASKLKKAADDKSLYQRKADAYRFNATSLAQAEKNQKNSSWYSVQNVREGADNKKANMKKFETELFDYDTKNKAGSTEGYTAQEYAMAKTSGTYKSRAAKTNTAKTNTAKTDTAKTDTAKTGSTKSKKSYDQAYKDTRNHKVYGKMDKATYIKEAKRQNASFKAGKGWDVKKVYGKKVEISTKLDPKALKSQATKVNAKTDAKVNAKTDAKVNAKTEPKKEVKKTRSQKLRSKGEKALADGDKKKALRIRRRYDKQVAKETKKKGQAAGAIEVKKKTKKQSFNAVTNKSGYDSFKKAGGLSAWSKGEIEVK